MTRTLFIPLSSIIIKGIPLTTIYKYMVKEELAVEEEKGNIHA